MSIELSDILKKLKKEKLQKANFLFEYCVGNDFAGFADFELRGNGSGRIKSNETKNRVLLWEDFKIQKKNVLEIIDSLIQNKIWSIVPGRDQPLDDERKIQLTIRLEDRSWLKEFWEEDISQNTNFKAIQRDVLSLVKKVSKGKVLAL